MARIRFLQVFGGINRFKSQKRGGTLFWVIVFDIYDMTSSDPCLILSSLQTVGKNILIMLNDLALRPQSAKDNVCQDYLIIYENDNRQLVKTCHSYPFNLQVASNTARISLVSNSLGWTSKGVWLFYKGKKDQKSDQVPGTSTRWQLYFGTNFQHMHFFT